MKTLVTLALAFGILWGCSDSEEDLRTDTPTPAFAPYGIPTATPCQTGDPVCVTSEPQEGDLSPGQMALAQRIADDDQVLADLLEGVSYESRVSVYQAQLGVDGTFVTIEYGFSDALHVDADLPHIDTGHRGGEEDPTQITLPSPGYRIVTSHHEIDAWSLMVTVLLEEEQVVLVLPLPFGPADNPPTGAP